VVLASSPLISQLERVFGDSTAEAATSANTLNILTWEGYHDPSWLAEFKRTEATVVFQSGFTANAGTVSSILGKDDFIISDELNHASIIDGARLSRATIKVFPHRDADSARAIVKELPRERRRLIISDGVFSMDGDVAPLAELAALCKTQQATLMIDDAHGVGVLGAEGAGSISEAGLDCSAVPVLMGTLGKALGVAGAFVAGSAALIAGLVQFARAHIYTTALPPALASAPPDAPQRLKLDLYRQLWRHQAA